MPDTLGQLKAVLADRYTIERELGRGGMGIVYQVYDRQRDEKVALKTLHWSGASAVYRFKNEFRALADVAHRNLVQLYEMVALDDIWFFTMELVEGRDFIRHVRPDPNDPPLADEPTVPDAVSTQPAMGVRRRRERTTRAGTLDEARLRAALRQLLQGVAALHRAGKVHRDLKPSNVLVSWSGRVVILDFGITGEISPSGTAQTIDETISGTVEYMAPEQCSGDPCGPASDWYSVGVLLYEALTGQLPFTGPVLKILQRKQVEDPLRPDQIVPDLPRDLVELCVALMRRDPNDRPSDPSLLGRLRVSEPRVAIDSHMVPAETSTPVGREAELEALDGAFRAVCAGQSVSVCVHGPSGIGKTTLVRHFTRELVQSERAVVLAGRCYARESVPYKALDGMIDKMSRLLCGVPDADVAARLPKDTAALAWVFPALRRVPAIDRLAEISPETSDRRVLRKRAFTALRDALEAISRERPLVIHIDDLQWTDQDSIDVLDELLQSCGAAPVMFILSFRSEEVANLPFLERLLASADTHSRRILEIGPLTTDNAAGLIETMLGPKWPGAYDYAMTLARESGGNPFLLDQMARVALAVGSEEDTRLLRLGEMLNTRIGQMPEGARELLEVLAVAGQPIDADVAYQSAGLTGDERPLVGELQLAHLLRTSASGTRIDVYHDRIREHVAHELSTAEVRTIHRSLAMSLSARGIDDPEALYEHYLGSRDPTRAAVFAAKAAQVAQKALAFERAAHFYRQAVELSAGPGPQTALWYVGLGDALACAGRGAEAADAYLEASRMSGHRAALDLERHAGQQLLISGRIEEGMEVLGRVLERVDLSLARSPMRALLKLLLRRLRLRIRGLKYHERDAKDIPVADLTKIDTCWAVAEGMALVDNIQGAAFQTQHLILALDAGEPQRIARALAMEAGFVSSTGSDSVALQLLSKAEGLAERIGSESTIGLCRMIGTARAFHVGDCEEADRLAREAVRILSVQASQVIWPLNIAKVYHIPILVEMGKVAELCRLSKAWYADAMERGNLFGARMFSTGWGILVWLSKDDLAGAREALAAGQSQHRAGTYHLADFYDLIAQVLIDLYAEDADAAYRHVNEAWPLLEKSQLMRIRVVRQRTLLLRAWSCLALARKTQDNARLLRRAKRDARLLEREPHYSAESNRARGQMIYAGIQAILGDRGGAIEHLRAAVAGFESTGAQLFHAVAQRRLGELLGGDEGQALIDQADAWFASEGIVRPQRVVGMLGAGVG